MASYFIEESCPYTKKRTLNKKRISCLLGLCLVGFVFYVLIFAEDPKSMIPFYEAKPVAQTQTNRSEPETKNTSGYITPWYSGNGAVRGGGGINTSARQRNANQVIVRGNAGGDPGSRLPMGFGINVRLVNTVHSMSSNSPVIAEVSQDVFSVGGSTLMIPANTRVIGSVMFSNQDRRLEMRFHTFVYPDGSQSSLQGLGMMSDGSVGITGDYHSEGTKRQIGRFIGTFVGGLAEGMKDRTASGMSGTPYEIGSVKNGLLNGAARSAEDQTKVLSEDLAESKPYMTLEPGQNFIIYLEKELNSAYQ